ncbi:hypothetical protein [Flavobacterium sp. ZB4R12]
MNPKQDKYDPYDDEIKTIQTELMKLLGQLLPNNTATIRTI